MLSHLLGNLVVKSKKAEFVMTRKLLLLQYNHPVRIPGAVLLGKASGIVGLDW